MTQLHIQEPLQFVRTSLKCSVKYLKISAYIVRSIAHFHNALIKAFIYSILLSPLHKWFLLSEDEYLGLYLIIFYRWVKKPKQQQQNSAFFCKVAIAMYIILMLHQHS